MNRYICLVLLSLYLICLPGCSPANDPAGVVKSHIKKLAHEDIAGAARLCTGKALENTESFKQSVSYAKSHAGEMGMEPDFYLDNWADLKANMVLEVVSETESTAKVCVTYQDRTGTYTLTKIDGRWIINRFKDEVFGFKATVEGF